MIMEVLSIIQAANSIIRAHVTPEYKTVLFGSHAQGNALPTSDIDIGIIGPDRVPFSVMTKILDKIEEIPTLRKIDIVDLRTVDIMFQKNVLSYAKRI